MQAPAYCHVVKMNSACSSVLGSSVASVFRGASRDVGSSQDMPTSSQSAVPRVITHHHGAWSFHDARYVSRFFAADKYTCFLQGGQEQLLTESLNALEIRLRDHGFLRVHRGELVNLAHVVQIRRASSSVTLVLRDGQAVAVSRRQVPALRRCLRV
jgi:two-component system LytT family response regulator